MHMLQCKCFNIKTEENIINMHLNIHINIYVYVYVMPSWKAILHGIYKRGNSYSFYKIENNKNISNC